MSNLTKAQQALLERAHNRAYVVDGHQGERNMRSHQRLIDIAAKYGKPHHGATRLHGGADFRVAYALQDKGVARVVSCPIVDGYWLIAEEA